MIYIVHELNFTNFFLMILLKPQEIIDIVATGRADPDPHNLEITKCIGFIESWGYRARVHPDTFGEDSFYANSDEGRLKALKQAVYSADSKAIWCLRGGYGTTRVLENLSADLTPPYSKTLIGLSDCTALLLYAYKHWSWTVIHGPVLARMAKGDHTPETYTTLKELLHGSLDEISYGETKPLNEAAQRAFTSNIPIEGPTLGGNLCLLQSSIGTPWMPLTDGHILFIEDINESPFRTLERVQHLKMNGLLKKIKALIIFDFMSNPDEYDPNLEEKAFERIGKEINPLPVFKASGVGHGRMCLPTVFGEIIKIVDKKIISIIK